MNDLRMDDLIRSVTSDLSEISADAEAQFGGLSGEQLNWKPDESSWSVAQCLDHLITTHGLYFPLLDELADGEATPSLWERISPLSGFFGRILIRSMHPDNRRKLKTTRKAEPASSGVDADIVDRFAEHQRELVAHIEALPRSLDPERMIVTSPLLGVVTYSLHDCLTIFVVHGRRHLEQAGRVMEASGFPK